MVRMTLFSSWLGRFAKKSSRVLPTSVLLVALTLAFSSNTTFAQLSGAYSIGTGQTYTTLVAFANALNSQGVSGPVVATVLPGTYTGSVSFNAITGASSTNTITIRGANVNTSIIEAPTNSSNTYVIRLYGTDYMRIEDLTIKALGTNYGYGIWFRNQADYNEITDCKVSVSQTSTSSYCIGILASGSSYSSSGNNANYNTIEGNEVTGGTYAIRFNGLSSSTNCNYNEFIENTITGFYRYGIYLYYQGYVVVDGNTMIDRKQTTSAYGLYTYYNLNGPKYTRNYISAGYYGIYAERCNYNNSIRGQIANNMIVMTGSGYNYGMRLYYYCRKMDIDHNSVNCLSPSSYGYGLYLYQYGSDNKVRNNIFRYQGNYYSYFVYIYPTSQISSTSGSIDYNVFYAPNSSYHRWYYGPTHYSLSAFMSYYSTQNNNSWMYNPEYNDNYDLHTYSQNLNGSGTPLTTVTEDFDGQTRSTTAPDIGADEYTLFALDAGAVSLLAPTAKCGLGATENVTVGIRNYGTSIIDASVTPITLHITALGGMNQNFSGTMTSGLIAPGATYYFTLMGVLNLSVPGPYTIDAYITMPGDGNSANNAMNTASLFVDGTITSFPYFQDFEANDGSFRSVSLGGADDWAYGTPNNTPLVGGNSGTKAWATGLTANYNNGAHAALMAPCLDFSTLSSPVVQFYGVFSTESPYDGWAVEASSNGGATWTRLTPYYPAYNYTYSYGPQGAPQYAERTQFNSWQKYVFLLGSFAGNPNVKFRWRFGSDSSVQYPGVAIDDVAIGDFYQKDIVVTDVVYDNATNYWARRVGADHVVHARVVNFGYEKNPATVPLTYKEGMIPSFQGDGVGESFSMTWNGAESWVTFTTPHMPMNSGPMTMYVRAFYPGDLDGSNDMAKTTPIIQPPTVYGYEDFNTLTPPNWEKLWTVNDVNGGETWVTEAGIGNGGTVAATYPGDVTAADDWLFTPGALLEAGSSYSLDFQYRSRNGDAQILEVAFGSSPNPSAMTVFATYSNFTDMNFTPGLGQYGVAPFFATPNVAQLYYIGFHVKSAAGMGPMDLDDIRLYDNPFPPPKIAYGINPVYSSDPLIPIKFSGVYKKTGLLSRTYEVINSTGWYGNPEGDMLWDVNTAASWVDLFKSTPDPLTFLTVNPFSPPWARQRQTFTMEINAGILAPGTHTTSLDFDAYLYNNVYTRGIRASNAIFSVPVELTLSAAGGSGSGANSGSMSYASMDPSGNPWIFQDTQGNVFAVVNVTGGFIPSMTITSYPGQLPKHISRYRYVDHYWTIDATGTGWTTDIEFHYFDSEVQSGGVIDEWWLRGIRIPKGMGYWEDPIMNTMSMPNAFDNNVMVVNINDKNFDGEIALAHDWNIVPSKQSAGNTPSTFSLDQNYPNPFNPSTEIRFGIPTEEHVTLTVINNLGEEVASIVNQVLPAGFHAYNFDAKDMPSGMYLYTITAGNFVQTRTMILNK
jgi:parallel beta helix pectate lyase-like protein/reelin-like protein